MRNEIRCFFEAFLKSPAQVSSVIPTSRFAVRKVCAKIAEIDPKVLVEYGPGTGGITRHLLERNMLRPDATVMLIEKSAQLADALKETIRDTRVRIACDGAENVECILADHKITRADCVVSSIPLAFLCPQDRLDVLEATKRILAPDGKCIVFLFRREVGKRMRQVFGHVTSETALWNMPPLCIFTASARPMAQNE